MTGKKMKIAVIGSALGGGAAQVIDALTGSAMAATAIFDNDERARTQSIHGVPVLGDSAIATIRTHLERGTFEAAVIAIGGDLHERQRVFNALQAAGVPLANVIDPSVQLRAGVKLGVGNVLLGGVYVGPDAEIGDNCYIIGPTTIQHESRIGSHSYFSIGVALGGRIIVGERVRFDIRSAVRSKLNIGDDCTIGAGCVVGRDLAPGSRVEPVEYRISRAG